MGNKIVTIQNTYQLSSTQYQETFLDISMVSEKSSLETEAFACPDIFQYISYLKTECPDSDLTAVYVYPGQSEEEIITLLALFFDTDYYTELVKYKKYIERMQYKIANINDVQAVKNSLHNIFTWTPGQRILNPDFGSRLDALLYEGMTTQNKEKIVAEIRSTALTWEPRVRIIDIIDATSTQDVENNTVHLEILFTIPALTQNKQYSETLLYNTTQI